MKPLYIVGTQRNVGKTTFCLGLINALRQRGLTVGYTKPLGQRVTMVAGQQIHDDALVVSKVLHLDKVTSIAMSLTRGKVEKEIFDLHTPQLAEKVIVTCKRLQETCDVVVVESMGHVAMGSVLKLSSGDVARLIGARPLLISGGGIGRAIDDICLCATFLAARESNLMGVIVNKVWLEKYDRVKEATTKGLDNLGIRSYGTVPYSETLASPTVGQVAQLLAGRIICGTSGLGQRIGKTVVAAMETTHMVGFLKDRALVIAAGDRNDTVLGILSTYALMRDADPPVAGLILTGGFVPTGRIMELLVESDLPTIQCNEDTYSVAARLQETVFKIAPEDSERIETAVKLIGQYVDIDGILDGLRD